MMSAYTIRLAWPSVFLLYESLCNLQLPITLVSPLRHRSFSETRLPQGEGVIIWFAWFAASSVAFPSSADVLAVLGH